VATVLRAHNLLQHIMREKGKDQIDGITNYIYIEKFPTLATPSYTDLEQQTPTVFRPIHKVLPSTHPKSTLCPILPATLLPLSTPLSPLLILPAIPCGMQTQEPQVT